ncbi:BQ5605_C022g09463 [Microbotryum silenes-dioicae]|uniref:BQ5605_C022g09463 protein n=1 Tax=Microbotryum silenes-dioicae TaxID=796604 RepID=A0A2X0N6U5_9BASI|nr:BQ5605_C022g09463 [Microbotryum silenes-dioicae]
MPELPEVERARRRLERLAVGRKIVSVIALEDTIVFGGTTAAAFATACQGRVVQEVRRKGKNFYLILDAPITPIFHFGMSGTSVVRGESGPVYRAPRAKTDPNVWPPKYAKACFKFDDGSEWAFCDSRRFGRIKLIEGVAEEQEPLVSLGADPFLAMPSVEVLAEALRKRNAPVKAVLLDQNGPLCGIGNWMIDEILYQAKLVAITDRSLHLLERQELIRLHSEIVNVTNTACAVDAESRQFPSHWLFGARWSKGKSGGKTFVLPNGETTTVTYITVGGRTSAVISSVQKLPPGLLQKFKKESTVKEGKRKAKDDDEGEEEGEEEEPVPREDEDDAPGSLKGELQEELITSPHFKRSRKVAVKSAAPPKRKLDPDPMPAKRPRRSARTSNEHR